MKEPRTYVGAALDEQARRMRRTPRRHGRIYTFYIKGREVPLDEWALDEQDALRRRAELQAELGRTVAVYVGQTRIGA